MIRAMDMQVLPWIKDDVAIEIIGKMIAEQVQSLNEWVADFIHAGFDADDAIVVESPEYKEYIRRISEYKGEINQIYTANNLDKLHIKITQEYAPYLKGKYGYKFSIV